MKLFNKILWLVALSALSTSIYASGGFDFTWTSPPGDKSIEFLGQLFGPVGNVLQGPTSGLIGAIVQIFNLAVLSLGAIVVSYTIIVSTMNTAQEGEVMGRKWSSAWIPLRAAIGASMLIPAPTFSLIQILFMNITLMGVHAANQIWQLIMGINSSGSGVYGSNTDISDENLKDAALQVFKTLVCKEMVEKALDERSPLPGSNTMDTQVSGSEWFAGLGTTSDLDDFCGGLKFPGNPSWSGGQYDSYVELAIRAAENNLSAAAEEAANDIDNTGNQWTQSAALVSAIRAMRSALLTAASAYATNSSNLTSEAQQAIDHGWLYAGSYYFVLTEADSSGSGSSLSFPVPSAEPMQAKQRHQALLGDYADRTTNKFIHHKVSTAVRDYLEFSGDISSGTSSQQPNSLTIQSPSIGNSQASKIMNKVAEPLRNLAYKFMDTLTERYEDPLASIRRVGSDIMVTVETIWFAIIIIAFILLIAGCTMSGMQPLCWAIGVIGTILMPILSFMLALLWVIGVTMGIYTPMIPYLVFTFTALGWFILVIETIVAAPIVAMGIVSPAHEVLGKAAPAVMLITGVFLRPSLMLIGFVGGVLLLKTIVEMINYGFVATLEASVAGVGVFGVIAIVCLYGGLVLALVHECFSLVYVLPDKILRWIGGQAEQSTVSQNVKEAEKSVQKGAEVGSGLMKGTAQMATEKVTQKAVDMNAPGKGGGGGGGGGGSGMGF